MNQRKSLMCNSYQRGEKNLGCHAKLGTSKE